MNNKYKLVLLLAMILIMLLALTGCGVKKSMTAAEFKTAMENEGYTVSDITDQFKNYTYINQVYMAENKDGNIKIDFYDITSDNDASSVFNNNKALFNDSKEKNSAETSSNGKNYEFYTLSSNQSYKTLSRINSTMISSDNSSEYKNDIETIIKKLGY